MVLKLVECIKCEIFLMKIQKNELLKHENFGNFGKKYDFT